MNKHYKPMFLLLATLMLPSLAIALLGWRDFTREREKQLKDAEAGTKSEVRQQLLQTLERIKLQEISGAPSDPAVVFTASVQRDRLVLPWDADSAAARFRDSIEEPDFARKILQAKRAEGAEKRYDHAAALYRDSIQEGKSEDQRVYARFQLAGALARSARQTEAFVINRDLLRLSTSTVDEHGVPFAYYAGQRIASAHLADRDVLDRVGHDLKTLASVPPHGIYVLKEVLETLRRSNDSKQFEMPLAFDNMADRPIKGTISWRGYDVVLDVPAGATGIAFGILLAGPGTVWLSSAKFEIVGANIPATDKQKSNLQGPTNLTFDLPPAAIGEVPKGWLIDGSKPSDYAISVDSGNSYEGFPAVYLRSKKPQIDGFGTLAQVFSASQYAGKRVRFSAFVKSDSVMSWSGLWMRVDGKQIGVPLGFDNMQNRPIKGTTAWRNYEVVLDVPPEATGIFLGILLDGTGTVWISGAKFEETNVPTTDKLKSASQGPTNLGFDKK
jgi:hypothetical protein